MRNDIEGYKLLTGYYSNKDRGPAYVDFMLGALEANTPITMFAMELVPESALRRFSGYDEFKFKIDVLAAAGGKPTANLK